MPLIRADFHEALDRMLGRVEARSPLVPDDPRKQIFSSYTPTVGTPQLSFQISPTSWLTDENLIQELRYVCWHDAAPATGGGNCVAITPRHVLMSEHGHEPEYQWLTWMAQSGFDYEYPATPDHNITIWGGVAQPPGGASVYSIEQRQIVNIDNSSNTFAFRVTYLHSEVPRSLICPLLRADDLDPSVRNYTFTDVPYIFVNQFNEAVIGHCTNNAAKGNLVGNSPAAATSRPPGVTAEMMRRRGCLYRQAIVGDSGSPAFWVVGRADDQAKLYLAGFVTWRNTEGHDEHRGPSVLSYYAQIVEACRILNARHATTYNAPNYLPIARPTY